MLAYLRLMRPLNCLMTAAGVFVGGLLIAGKNISILFSAAPLFLAMISALLIAGAGNAINDYCDVDADRVNRPGRPIPSGRISRRTALIFSVALFLTGILISGFINWVTFIIAIINAVLLVIYSYSFQNKVLVGNLSISYLVGSSFLFGGAAMGNIILPLWLLLLAGLANMFREIVKDIDDMEGDKAGFLKQLTVKVRRRVVPISERFGIGKSGLELKYGHNLPSIAAAFLVLTILVSPGPFVAGVLGMSYLVMLVPTNIVFLGAIAMLFFGRSRKKYARASTLVKVGMALGLLAFVAGVLF